MHTMFGEPILAALDPVRPGYRPHEVCRDPYLPLLRHGPHPFADPHRGARRVGASDAHVDPRLQRGRFLAGRRVADRARDLGSDQRRALPVGRAEGGRHGRHRAGGRRGGQRAGLLGGHHAAPAAAAAVVGWQLRRGGNTTTGPVVVAALAALAAVALVAIIIPTPSPTDGATDTAGGFDPPAGTVDRPTTSITLSMIKLAPLTAPVSSTTDTSMASFSRTCGDPHHLLLKRTGDHYGVPDVGRLRSHAPEQLPVERVGVEPGFAGVSLHLRDRVSLLAERSRRCGLRCWLSPPSPQPVGGGRTPQSPAQSSASRNLPIHPRARPRSTQSPQDSPPLPSTAIHCDGVFPGQLREPSMLVNRACLRLGRPLQRVTASGRISSAAGSRVGS